MSKFFVYLTAAGLACSALTLPAQEKKAPKPVKPKATSTRWDLMDLGPFFSSGLEMRSPGAPVLRPALKGLSIRVGDNQEATVCFDTERLRLAAAWSGGFIKLPTGREGLEGVPQPAPGSVLAFSSEAMPGWADKNGNFQEAKPPMRDGGELVSFGPLPREWAHYRGLYVNGKKVILSYTVGNASVLEMPGYNAAEGSFTRTFQIENFTAPLTMLVADAPTGGKAFRTRTTGDAKAEPLTGANGRLLLKLTPTSKNATFQVAFWAGPEADAAKFTGAVVGQLPDLKALTKGGPANYPETVETKGVLGKSDWAYAADTLTLPENNPWHSWLRLSGFDFFKDGKRAAICSVSGDVWIVSGIDDNLEHLKWKRYANGLFEPLGLKIVDDVVYVLGRDQITRLRDLNGDDEADFYENFNNDIAISSHYHEFALDLQTDSKGNFYFSKGGNLGQEKHQHHGSWLRVSKDGSKLEVLAYGLRAPNGSAIGPHDEMTVSDNEGNWVPASRVNLIKPGGFYGHMFTSHDERLATQLGHVEHYVDGRMVESLDPDSPKLKELMKKLPMDYEKPILWLPHDYAVDNSSGGQVWVTSDKWGPFKGDLLHTSYGGCNLFKVMMETVDGQVQGGAWKFPLKFDTGVMRARFNPGDGQLYLCGLVVWQSNGTKTGGFNRVRYTHLPVDQPREIHVQPNGLTVTFTDALDMASANDLQNYDLEQWNYQWTHNYGSKEYSTENPNEIKHDKIEIKSVKVSSDHKSIFLETANVKEVMQMRLRFTVRAADGVEIKQTIWNTVNKVPAKTTSLN